MEYIFLVLIQVLCIACMIAGLFWNLTNAIIFSGFILLVTSTRMLFMEYFGEEDDDYVV